MVDESSYLDNDNSNPLKRFLGKAWPEADMEAKAWVVEEELRQIYDTGFLLLREEDLDSIPSRDRDLSYHERLDEFCIGLHQEKTMVVDIMQDDPKFYGFLNAPVYHRNKKSSNRVSNDKRAPNFGTQRQPRRGPGVQKKSAPAQKSKDKAAQQIADVVFQAPSRRNALGSDGVGRHSASTALHVSRQQAREVSLSAKTNLSSQKSHEAASNGATVAEGSGPREDAPSEPVNEDQTTATAPCSNIALSRASGPMSRMSDLARQHHSISPQSPGTPSSLGPDHLTSPVHRSDANSFAQPPQGTAFSTMPMSRKRRGDTMEPSVDTHAPKKQCTDSDASQLVPSANVVPFRALGLNRSAKDRDLGPPRPMTPMRRFMSQPSFQDPRSLLFGQCPGFQTPTPFAAQRGPQHTLCLAQQEHGNQSLKQALPAIPQHPQVAAQVPEEHINGAESEATDMPGLCSIDAIGPLKSQNAYGPDEDFLSSLDMPTFTTPPPGDQQMGCAEVPQNLQELQLPDLLRFDDMLPENASIGSTSNIEPRPISPDDLFGDLNFGSIDDSAFDDDALDFGLPLVMSSDTNSSPLRNGVSSNVVGPELQPEPLTPETPAAQAYATAHRREGDG